MANYVFRSISSRCLRGWLPAVALLSIQAAIPEGAAQSVVGPPAETLAGRVFGLAMRRRGSSGVGTRGSRPRPFENGSVGPLLAAADAMRAGRVEVIAWPDSAGGAGSLKIRGVSSES